MGARLCHGVLSVLLLAAPSATAAVLGAHQYDRAAPPPYQASVVARQDAISDSDSTSKPISSVISAAASPYPSHTVPEFTQSFYFPSITKSTIYKTEPTFRPEIFDIVQQVEDRSLLAPGYFFLDPTFTGKNRGFGPWITQIYDQDGGLIYYGSKAGAHGQETHVCDYLGEKGKHICTYRRLNSGMSPYSSKLFQTVTSGVKFVMDQSYRRVGRNFRGGMWGFGGNGHEFNMIEGGESFLQPINYKKGWDLSPYQGPEHGWIEDGCFQEVDVRTEASLFAWCWADHIPHWQTAVFLMPEEGKEQHNITSWKGGRGTQEAPWDLVHINSIDKNADGDYLVSARHADMVVKIAGNSSRPGIKPGSVLWKLGGAYSDFEMKGFTFSKQHMARFVSSTESETVISLFDNAWFGANDPSNDYSAGQLIRLNTVTMKAELQQEYPHPEGLISAAKGSMQVIKSNGNAFIGWGRLPSMTEYSPNGTVLWHARYSAGLINRTSEMDLLNLEHSYRAYKQPWVGKPYWDPKLLAYSKTCDGRSPLMAYVSWNGATEVAAWRFSSTTADSDKRTDLGTFKKTAFEVEVMLLEGSTSGKLTREFQSRVLVEALDAESSVLGSVWADTFVPSASIRDQCDDRACEPERYEYNVEDSIAKECVAESTQVESQQQPKPLPPANQEHPDKEQQPEKALPKTHKKPPKQSQVANQPSGPEHSGYATLLDNTDLFTLMCIILLLGIIESLDFLLRLAATSVVRPQKSWLYARLRLPGARYESDDF